MSAESRTAARRPPLTVLLVEDEDGVRAFVRQVLEHTGHAVVATADADTAERAFRAEPGRFDLLLTDVLMPGRTGPQLAAALRSVRPGLPVLFMSGYPGAPTQTPDPLIPPGAALLDKPFTIDRLLHAVTVAVGNHVHPG
jgi:two-component system cell cycle sensor histidine kinase/response regulator CckA